MGILIRCWTTFMLSKRRSHSLPPLNQKSVASTTRRWVCIVRVAGTVSAISVLFGAKSIMDTLSDLWISYTKKTWRVFKKWWAKDKLLIVTATMWWVMWSPCMHVMISSMHVMSHAISIWYANFQMQLTKLKERMKVIISHVQQVEKKIDGVKINRSKVNNNNR